MINQLRIVNDKTYSWKEEFALILRLVKLFQLTEKYNYLNQILKDENKKPEEILADSWEIIIRNFIQKYSYKPGGYIELFCSDRNHYLELAKDESKSDVDHNGDHLKSGALIIRDAITTEFIGEIKRHFLFNLNKTLTVIENSVIEQAILLLQKGKSYAEHQQAAPSRYDVQLVIKYFIENYNNPAHTFQTSFNYNEIIVEKKYGKFLSDDNEKDIHREKNLQTLDEPYSFLLVEIINNGSLRNKIYEIEKIEVEIIYSDYQGLLHCQNLITFQYNKSLRLFAHNGD